MIIPTTHEHMQSHRLLTQAILTINDMLLNYMVELHWLTE